MNAPALPRLPTAPRRPQNTRAVPSEAPLAKIRDALGVSKLTLAVAARVSVKVVNKLESGDLEKLTLGALMRVALVLGASPVELVPGLKRTPPRGSLPARARTLRDVVESALTERLP